MTSSSAPRFDLLVVGSGPVGLATAIWARLAGLSVAVFDRKRPPIDKACGEGLMPAGLKVLKQMGVNPEVLSGRPFEGIRYIDGETTLEGRFKEGPGLGLRRLKLSEALVARANELGAELFFNCGVAQWHHTAQGAWVDTEAMGRFNGVLLVGADGLHSKIRSAAGLSSKAGRHRRYGVRAHFAVKPWSPFVEVYWQPLGESYVTPVGPNEVGVAILTHEKPGSFEVQLNNFPALKSRVGSAEVVSRSRGAGPLEQRVRRQTAPGLALVGDAAGYLDALTGEGLTLGLETAQALVNVIAQGLPLVRYEADYKRIMADYYSLTGGLLWLSRHPRLRSAAFKKLRYAPRLFENIVALNAGQAKLSQLLSGVRLTKPHMNRQQDSQPSPESTS